MIRFEDVTVTYVGADGPAVSAIDLQVPEGELCLLVGRTGSGKSTVLRAVNGLVPHFSGGTMSGRVTVDGRDTREHPPRELADVVGMVGQDPTAGFVTDVVEEELAYTMESLGVPAPVMRRRVEETLDLLGLADLRDRPLRTLSGGQRQRVAIGSVLTAHPKVLVLDEPTSALDPGAAEEVLAAIQRLVHDLGITVLMAEHRLERVVQYADRVALMRPAADGRGNTLLVGDPGEVLADSPVVPSVVELGRLAGWTPLPLSVRDARRRAPELRERLHTARPAPTAPRTSSDAVAPALLHTEALTVRLGRTWALRGVDFEAHAGEIVAVMGRNGAGKSTLLNALAGVHEPTGGTVDVGGAVPHTLHGHELVSRVGLVPQDAGDLLWAEDVAAECAAADHDARTSAGTARAILADLAPEAGDDQHPRDLSEGQRLALALSVVLAAAPSVVLLDEPTRGLDYPTKTRLVAALRALAARGHAVIVSTHDVELVAELANRVVILAEGEVVADGRTEDVLVSSPAFAPQVAKILAPERWLTVESVAAALAVTG